MEDIANKTDNKVVNYAEDPIIKHELEEKIMSVYRACKRNRLATENAWERYLKIWSMQRHDNQRYMGRADLRHSTPRKAAETVIRKLYGIILPEQDYFSVLPNPNCFGSTMDSAKAVESVLKHYYEGQTDLFGHAFSFFRQYVAYGTTAIKTGWKTVEKVRRKKGGEWESYKYFDAPTIRHVDLFRFYVFPWNIHSLDEATFVFEDFFTTKDVIKKWVKDGFYCGEPQPFVRRMNPDNRLQNLTFQDPTIVREHGVDIYNMFECYVDHEINGMTIPLKVHMQESGECFMAVANDFNHGCHPYSSAQYVRHLAPLFYGQGIFDVIESASYELNDISNQIMDNKTMLLCPPIIVDPNLVRNHSSLKWSPMAKWLGDPAGFKMLQIQDTTATGHAMRNEVKNEILEASDASPNMPPQMRGQSRTATRDQMMNVEMNSELSEFIRQLGLMFIDATKKTHSNIIQNMDEEMKVKVLSKNSNSFMVKNITAERIAGDYDFRWLTSSKTQMDRVKTQQMIGAIDSFAKAGVKMNLEEAAKRVFKLGFGMDDAEGLFPDDKSSRKQEDENLDLDLGRFVPVHPDDNDTEHLQELSKGLKSKVEEVRRAYEDHKKRHEDADKLKKQLIEQSVQQQQQAAMGILPAIPGQQGAPQSNQAPARGTSGTPYKAMPTNEGDTMKGIKVT